MEEEVEIVYKRNRRGEKEKSRHEKKRSGKVGEGGVRMKGVSGEGGVKWRRE